LERRTRRLSSGVTQCLAPVGKVRGRMHKNSPGKLRWRGGRPRGLRGCPAALLDDRALEGGSGGTPRRGRHPPGLGVAVRGGAGSASARSPLTWRGRCGKGGAGGGGCGGAASTKRGPPRGGAGGGGGGGPPTQTGAPAGGGGGGGGKGLRVSYEPRPRKGLGVGRRAGALCLRASEAPRARASPAGRASGAPSAPLSPPPAPAAAAGIPVSGSGPQGGRGHGFPLCHSWRLLRAFRARVQRRAAGRGLGSGSRTSSVSHGLSVPCPHTPHRDPRGPCARCSPAPVSMASSVGAQTILDKEGGRLERWAGDSPSLPSLPFSSLFPPFHLPTRPILFIPCGL
jgi:hypothetical protein